MEIFSTNSVAYKNAIAGLYLESFATGDSQQYIDKQELNNYLDDILTKGYAIVAVENSVLKAAVLVVPLSMDKDLPAALAEKFSPHHCLYVAELMVTTEWRGKGLGNRLMQTLEATADVQRYKQVFIRVWTENRPALNLYLKRGFTEIATIQQTKRTANGKDTFVMNKMYLHKTLI